MNARYLQYEQYGQHASDLRDPATITDFLANVPRYQEKLAAYTQNGNRDLLDALDSQLDSSTG